MVGASGFEPPASWSRTRRASQAALRPDDTHSSALRKRPEWNIQNSIAHRLSLERGGLDAFHSRPRNESARHGESMIDSVFDAGPARLNAGAVL
jgi:hypothetical protein